MKSRKSDLAKPLNSFNSGPGSFRMSVTNEVHNSAASAVFMFCGLDIVGHITLLLSGVCLVMLGLGLGLAPLDTASRKAVPAFIFLAVYGAVAAALGLLGSCLLYHRNASSRDLIKSLNPWSNFSNRFTVYHLLIPTP